MAVMSQLTDAQRHATANLLHNGEVYFNTQHKSIVLVMYDNQLKKIKPNGNAGKTGGTLDQMREGRGAWEEITDLPGGNYPSKPTGDSLEDTLAWLDGKAAQRTPEPDTALDSFLRNNN